MSKTQLTQFGRAMKHLGIGLWASDFKEHFKTRDGIYCYPLTISDAVGIYWNAKVFYRPLLEIQKGYFSKYLRNTVFLKGFEPIMGFHFSRYRRSSKDIPSKIVKIEYPGHYELRLLSKNSRIRWNHVRVPVSHILGGEYIGLEEIDNRIWEVYYSPVWLGRFDERIMLIKDYRGRYFRRKV